MSYRTTRQFYQTVFPPKAVADPNFRSSLWMMPGNLNVSLSIEGWHASYRRAVAFQNPKLVWIRRGNVATVKRGKLVMRSEGDVFFIRRGESMGILPVDDQRFRMVTIDVTDALVAAVAENLGREFEGLAGEIGEIRAVSNRSAQMRILAGTLARAEQENTVVAACSRFFAELLEMPANSVESEPAPKPFHPITESILSLIERNCPPRINLRQLEQDFGYSRGHIISIFKADLRTTPQQFLLTYKVGVAAERLTRGGALHDIVYQLNFADQSHLTRAFQACLGVSPMRLANQVRRRMAA